MERQYSQYPGGAVGAALLLLRSVVGVWFARDGVFICVSAVQPEEAIVAIPMGLILITMAFLLIIGMQTLFAGIAGAVFSPAVHVYSHYLDPDGGHWDGWFYLLTLTFLAACLAMLGPGGYSLEARLSGWRTINLSSRTAQRRS